MLKSGSYKWSSLAPNYNNTLHLQVMELLRKLKRLIGPRKLKIKTIPSIHLTSRLRSLAGCFNTADDISPSIPTHSSLSSANAFWPEACTHISPRGNDDFCFVCQQSRTWLPPVAGTEQEVGSLTCAHISSRGSDDFFFVCQQPRTWLPPVADTEREVGSFHNVALSPSPPPILRPRNRRLLCKVGNGQEGDESGESTILGDQADSPLVSPPLALRPHGRSLPCKLGGENDEDESVIRPWVEDDSPATSTPPFLRGSNRPLPRNRGEIKQDEESHESTILWDKVPPALCPRHRNKSKRKGKEKSKKEEGAGEEDGFEWAVNSLSDTASADIWSFLGMKNPFEIAENRSVSLRSGSCSWSLASVSSDETGSTMDTAELWSGELLAISRDVTTMLVLL